MGRQSRPDVAWWASSRDKRLLSRQVALFVPASARFLTEPRAFARPVRVRACAGRGLPSWSRGGRSDSSRLDCEEQVGAVLCDEAKIPTAAASGNCPPAL